MGGADADSHSTARVESARKCARTCGSCLAVEGAPEDRMRLTANQFEDVKPDPGPAEPSKGDVLGDVSILARIDFLLPIGHVRACAFFFL